MISQRNIAPFSNLLAESYSKSLTDSVSLDLTNYTVQNKGSLADTLGNTLLFSLTNFPGGSGNSNPFLRLRGANNSTVQRGYNTGGTLQFDTQKTGTAPILLNKLPLVTLGNTKYYEFRIDLNESNSNPQISLTKLQVFQSPVSNLTGYNSNTGQLAGLNPVINLNKTVLMDASLNSGSGVGDVLVYLPQKAFTGNPYIYTYAEFQGADSGFEEFSYGITNGTTTPIGTFVDLSLSQTLSNTNFLIGDRITFTITLNNSSSTNATGVQVKDLLPSGFSFVSATPSQGTYDSQRGIWNVGTVRSGNNVTLTLTGTVLDATSAAAYTNVAEIIAADQLDPDSTVNNGVPTEDDYTSVLAPVIKLNLNKKFTTVNQQSFADVKQAIDTNQDGKVDQFIALPGDNVTYQITVTNSGVAAAKNVVIKDDLTQQLPVGLIVQNLELNGGVNLDTSGSGDGNPQTVEVLFNNIDPGTSQTITVNAKVSTDYITPINFTGKLGSVNPMTGEINTAMPEYQDVPFEGKLFLNYNVQKNQNNYSLQDIKEGRANFGFTKITSAAEVVSVNQNTLAPGAIKADGRLDVTNYAIQGQLNNGHQFKILGVENLIQPSNSDISLFLNPDPDSGSSSTGYIKNYSNFLPDDRTGSAGFLGNWVKNDNPQYLADLKVWENLRADGDLSNTEDEQAIINALSNFIENGTYSSRFFSNGYFTFNNNIQTEYLNFESGELFPDANPNSLVTILVTDTGVTITDKQGNSLGSFADLQTALDSLQFAQPTDVNVTIKDSNGDGQVQTRLQKIGGYNFNGNWSVKTISVDSNVQNVIFASNNGSANLDFSAINIVPNPQNPYQFILRGDNAKDTITGSNNADSILGSNGSDVLSGGDGDDWINGGVGNDTLTGGKGNDNLTGGSGADEFVFGVYFGNDMIHDWQNPDKRLNLSKLSISSSVLDSNNDGVINTNDNLATLSNGDLILDLTSVQGGTIAFKGITSIGMANVIL